MTIRHARGQPGLAAVGRDARAAGIAAVVGPLDRIGHHAHARGPGQFDQPRDHRAGADALVVVAHDDQIDAVEAGFDALQQVAAERVGDRLGVFLVDAHHVVRMPLLRAAQESLLDRRHPLRIAQPGSGNRRRSFPAIRGRCGLPRRRR